MTVAELIVALQRLPQDHRVVVKGYEDGYDDIAIHQLRIAVNVHSPDNHLFGRHSYEGHPDGDHNEDAVLLYRPGDDWKV